MVVPAAWLLLSFLRFGDLETHEDGHIRWNYSSVKRSKSGYQLVFTASIDRGWHLYSQSIEEGGPMPTSFTFDENDAVRLLGNVKEIGNPVNVYDSTFVMNVVWYENKVQFEQRIRVDSKTKVGGEIRYSVCSKERCIPASVRFNIDIGL